MANSVDKMRAAVLSVRAAVLSAIAVPAVAIALVAPSSALASGGTSGGAGLGGSSSSTSSQSSSGPSGGQGLSSGSSKSTKSQTHSSNKSTSKNSTSKKSTSKKSTSTKPASQASGDIVGLSWASFTVRTGNQRMSAVQAVIDAANAMNAADYPYVWAGGHPAAGAASVGSPGPGYTGHTIGFDCSGSVAAILSSADLWQPGTPVPADNGVIAQLRKEGLIKRGVGTGSTEVTLYDDPGVHIFMSIDGRYFGTGANSKGGPGWLTYSGVTSAFQPWHFVASALHATTTYGSDLTFGVGNDSDLLYGLTVGQQVQVHYKTAKSGALTATAVTGS